MLHLKIGRFIHSAFAKFQAQGMFLWKEFLVFFDKLFKSDTLHIDFGKWRLIKNQLNKFRSLLLGHYRQVTMASLLCWRYK